MARSFLELLVQVVVDRLQAARVAGMLEKIDQFRLLAEHVRHRFVLLQGLTRDGRQEVESLAARSPQLVEAAVDDRVVGREDQRHPDYNDGSRSNQRKPPRARDVDTAARIPSAWQILKRRAYSSSGHESFFNP